MFGLLFVLQSSARIAIEPLRPSDKQLRFGAVVTGLDLSEAPSDAVVEELQAALSEHGLLVLEGAVRPELKPQCFSELVRRLNPGAETIWRDQRTNPWEKYKAEHMGPAGTFQLPGCPEVLVLGTGEVNDHFGLSATLGGKRAAYGKDSGSQVLGGGALQFHLDGAFWRSPSSSASGLPCKIVGMRCIEAPAADGQPARTFDVDYGDGAKLTCPAGSTAFCSGVQAYDLLTEYERERAFRTTVVYAAHPFKRFAKCGMTRDGLRCVGGPELENAIDGSDDDGHLRLPLVWADPSSGRRALMPHTRCCESLEVAPAEGDAPPTIMGTEAARSYLHTLMRRAVEPELVYPLGWRPGDCAIWNNHAVWHSASGGLADDERRVMHLVAFDGVEDEWETPTRRAAGRVAPRGGAPPPSVLALIIGQTPRADLVVPLRNALSAAYADAPPALATTQASALTVRGALDGVRDEAVPSAGDEQLEPPLRDGSVVDAAECPLITRLRSGTPVTVRETELTPLLQAQLDEHAASHRGACVVLLLCAGRFDGLNAPTEAMTLLLPFETAAATANHLGVSDALLCVPTDSQRPYAIARWRGRLPPGAMLRTFVLPEDADDDALRAAAAHAPRGTAIILDFVGHPEAVAQRLRELSGGATVIDVGGAALAALQGLLRSQW